MFLCSYSVFFCFVYNTPINVSLKYLMLISAFVSSELCFLLQVMKIFKYEVKKIMHHFSSLNCINHPTKQILTVKNKLNPKKKFLILCQKIDPSKETLFCARLKEPFFFPKEKFLILIRKSLYVFILPSKLKFLMLSQKTNGEYCKQSRYRGIGIATQ